MNHQIVKLFGFVLVLYALLFGFTSYWSIFDANSLKANQANRRPLLEEQTIRRGSILADDGTVIARSRGVGLRDFAEPRFKGAQRLLPDGGDETLIRGRVVTGHVCQRLLRLFEGDRNDKP